MYEKIREFYENNVEIFNQLCEVSGVLHYDEIRFPMDEFDDFFRDTSPLEIARLVFNSEFNPNDKYFSASVYLESYEEKDYTDFLTDSTIIELAEYVYEEIKWRRQYKCHLTKKWIELYLLYVECGFYQDDYQLLPNS